jgi:hypothetical protein
MSSNDEDDHGLINKVKVSESFRRGVEYYLNNFEMRNAVCQIPYIGTSLDFIITSLGQKVQEQRLFESLAILQEEINFVDENKIDKGFLTTEVFLDIFRKTFDNCVNTRHRERIRLNCKILVGAITIDNLNERHSTEDFLSFVADLTPIDIMVGLEIYKQQRNRLPQFDIESQDNTELKFVVNSGWHELQKRCKLDEVDFKIALHKLSAAGLIKEIVGMYANYTGGLYLITSTFQRLMNFIRLSANDPLFNYKIQP